LGLGIFAFPYHQTQRDDPDREGRAKSPTQALVHPETPRVVGVWLRPRPSHAPFQPKVQLARLIIMRFCGQYPIPQSQLLCNPTFTRRMLGKESEPNQRRSNSKAMVFFFFFFIGRQTYRIRCLVPQALSQEPWPARWWYRMPYNRPPRGSEARLQVIGILLRTPPEIERVVSACWQP